MKKKTPLYIGEMVAATLKKIKNIVDFKVGQTKLIKMQFPSCIEDH